MDTWQNADCSMIPLVELPASMDYGFVQNLFDLGGSPTIHADLTHAGFLPGEFFDSLTTSGSTFILGVTLTYIWVDGDLNPTDMDNNGKYDVAFREIYYNNSFVWGNDLSISKVDIESVVLHESGHGLSQAHFGKLFATNKNNKLHFSPHAVMNAVYVFPQRELT